GSVSSFWNAKVTFQKYLSTFKHGLFILCVGASVIVLNACGAPSQPIANDLSPVAATPSSLPASTDPAEPMADPSPAGEEAIDTATNPEAQASPEAARATNPDAPPNYCNDLGSWVALIETQSFWVSICMENSDRGVYVGVDKQNPSQQIRLPLTEGQKGFFEAHNGNFMYIVASTPRGKFLTVTEGEKELLRERTLQWLENE
ncbi:MAG: hypothetical protein VKJ46_06530, partial [Leptolyngbyaceae bacterium]|nr:hypothetical protein [Leptolyngbyaceae bacterium]